MKHFEISIALRDSIIMITTSVKFETDMKMYIEIASYLVYVLSFYLQKYLKMHRMHITRKDT